MSGLIPVLAEQQILVALGFEGECVRYVPALDFTNFVSLIYRLDSVTTMARSGSVTIAGTGYMRTIAIGATGRVQLDKGGVSCP